MGRLSLFIVFSSVFCAALAQNETGTWLSFSPKYKYSDRWDISGELAYRTANQTFSNAYVELGPSCTIFPGLEVGVIYRARSNRNRFGNQTFEQRWAFQLEGKKKWDRWEHGARVQYQTEFEPRYYPERYWLNSGEALRLRYELTYTGLQKPLEPLLRYEFFLDPQSENTLEFYEQRFIVGVNYKHSSRWRFSARYLLKHDVLGNQTFTHVLSLDCSLRFSRPVP